MKNCCSKEKGLLIFSILVLVSIILFFFLQNQKQQNTSIGESDSSIIENEVEIEDTNKLTIEEQEIISEYLKENISELSPEKEVLGGKFYITSIDFLSDQKLIAEYEDGHIALKAEIDFEYLDSENIIIENFKIFN
jgi:hypothetical protein